jgi:hypothetical protein
MVGGWIGGSAGCDWWLGVRGVMAGRRMGPVGQALG